MAAVEPAIATPPANVRGVIRDLLTASSAFQTLDSATRKEIANGLVRISATALALASEAEGTAAATQPRRPIARAFNAGSEFSGVSAQRVADTTRQILNAVSFPRFVTELITGVFKALVDSNQQQMHSFVELIRNVAASTEGFADANVGVEGARRWLVERFPGSFVIEGATDDFEPTSEPLSPEEQAERDAETRLRLLPGASMPSEAALRTVLGIGSQDSVPTGDPENLVGLARAALARNRQQMLSTMVMLGLQRLVIDSGRLHAAMRFHIDTRSAATDDRGSSFDFRNETEAAGKFGYGPWGAEARVKNTIGYVSTQQTQTTEEMNTDLDLNSSVELVFRTDYVPLERLAGTGDVNRIRVNTLNPEAEIRMANQERTARQAAQEQGETARRGALSTRLARPTPVPTPPLTPPNPPGTQSTPAQQQPGGQQGTQQPAMQQPVAQQPPVQRPTQQPATQQPAQQPAAQQPVSRGSNTQQPTAQQPATQQPPTQQPRAPSAPRQAAAAR
jgi:hypothetical protein